MDVYKHIIYVLCMGPLLRLESIHTKNESINQFPDF